MQDESKKLFAGLLIIVAVSLLLTYYRSFISRDYDIIPVEPKSSEEAAAEAE